MNVIVTAITSAATMESQIPSTCQSNGKVSTAAIWNTRVLIKEMAAEISPLFRAVKNDEPKIANPENKKEKEKMENARTVKFKSASS